MPTRTYCDIRISSSVTTDLHNKGVLTSETCHLGLTTKLNLKHLHSSITFECGMKNNAHSCVLNLVHHVGTSGIWSF